MSKHIPLVVAVATLIALLFPSARDLVQHSILVPVGALLLVVIVIGLLWVRGNEAKNNPRGLEEIRPQTMRQPETMADKVEIVDFPKQKIRICVTYPPNELDTAAYLSARSPRCLDHPVSMEESRHGNYYSEDGGHRWSCSVCSNWISGQQAEQFIALAKTEVLKRKGGGGSGRDRFEP